MVERMFEAKVENLQDVLAFVDGLLEQYECPMKIQMQVDVAVEEIFVNIAQYAYPNKNGTAKVGIEVTEPSRKLSIIFKDSGIPYDPLAKPDPDISLPVQERQIGGLGIYMAKKVMDDMMYQRIDGQNILTICKNI